jgi:hypothetical protein
MSHEINNDLIQVETMSQHDQQQITGAHAPTFSVASTHKDKYSLEDYVQFAQNQTVFEQGAESPRKLCREMFLRLQIAKSASVCFTEWKVRFVSRELETHLDDLHSAHLLRQYFCQLRKAKQISEQRAAQFQMTKEIRSKYVLFARWREANG